MEVFLLLIIVIIFFAIYIIKDSENNNDSKMNNKSLDLEKVIKSKKCNKHHNKKKVKFNLDKNEIYLINPYYNKSMVKDKVKFGKKHYGKKILKNSNFFKLDKHIIKNSQEELVKRLKNNNDNNLFENQKGYWEKQTIDDYTLREYDNYTVKKFNEFKDDSQESGESISEVYDKLTNSSINTFSRVFSDSLNEMY